MQIAVFIDGTTNDHTDEYITNVLKMRRLLADSVTSLYFRGLGNEFDNEGLLGLPGRLFGGAFGAGAKSKRDEAYTALSAAWQKGDKIYLFGFSRGAAIIRDLAMKIYEQGLNGRSVGIEMLGLFDTVASFGIPGNNWNLFKNLRVAPNALRVRHAMALDEDRDMFRPTLVDQHPGLDTQEVWFPGAHSDIGGGAPESGLSDVVLKWVVLEAEKIGLQFQRNWHHQLRPIRTQNPHLNLDYKFRSPREVGALIEGQFHPGGEARY